MPVFAAKLVIRVTDLWFSDSHSPALWLSEPQRKVVTRQSDAYALQTVLFRADDAESAYAKALGMVSEDYDDANHDGPGDLTVITIAGVNELERVIFNGTLEEALGEPYGVMVDHMPAESAPKVRSRAELELFREIPKVDT